jgi:hypothetical protein
MLSRREMFASLAGGALLVACGGDDVATIGPVSCADNGTTVTISQNHGHVLLVTIEDINAGVDKTYDIMGTAIHTHQVTITAAQFAMLQTDTSITAHSTVESSHSHGIVVMCA